YTVLVVLHHTFDPDCTVPDSSASVTRGNTHTVDCLFHEDKGLLSCRKNKGALASVVGCFKEAKRIPSSQPEKQERSNKKIRVLNAFKKKQVKCYVTVPESVRKPCEQFVKELKKRKRIKVSTVEKCKVILAFCPVVSRAGTDIDVAVQKLNEINEGKPAVLVVLHHTFDTDCTVPESSTSVKRGNTRTVDCLFHEDKGLLPCRKNEEALDKVADWLKQKKKEQQGGSSKIKPEKKKTEKKVKKENVQESLTERNDAPGESLSQDEVRMKTREEVIALHKNGNGYKKIAKLLNIPRDTIGSIIRKFKLKGTVETLPGRGRKKILTATAVRYLKRNVEKNPRVTAKELKKTCQMWALKFQLRQ
ncbi:hypothetical protein NFI96_034362, partial [Prochilodus magdalenae]